MDSTYGIHIKNFYIDNTGGAYFKGVIHTDGLSDHWKTSIAVGDPNYYGCQLSLIAQAETPTFTGDGGYVSFANNPAADTGSYPSTLTYNAVLGISSIYQGDYALSTLTVNFSESYPSAREVFAVLNNSDFKLIGLGSSCTANGLSYHGIFASPNQTVVNVSAKNNSGVEVGMFAHSNGNGYMGTYTSNGLRLRTANTDRIYIDTSGNVTFYVNGKAI